MTINRATPLVPPVPPSTPDITRPSFFTKTGSHKWFGGSNPGMPDPDSDDIGWHEPETCSAVISRKEHPRDPTSILKLGLPDVLWQKTGEAVGLPTSSKAGTPGTMPIVASAWAKPDVKISKQAADGQLTSGSSDRIDKVLQELEAVSDPSASGTIRSTSSDTRTTASSAFVETHIRRGKAESIISTGSNDTVTIGEHSAHEPSASVLLPPPPLPTKDALPIVVAPTTSAESAQVNVDHPSMTTTFTTTLSSALKYVMRTSDKERPPAKHHHALLSAAGTSAASIDERPHIRYEWTIGRRLRFSCTAYYAKEFDALRRRCGVDDVFLRSLARSKNWAAEGGKSKSNFWKTMDERFIIKTLVNAWNVADLYVVTRFHNAI
jgi:1-phosphatidylinositol-3-phosphate 5-kinase